MQQPINTIPDITQWQDMGLSGTDDDMPPLDWRKYALKDFGIYSSALGIMSGEGMGLAAEVETYYGDNGLIYARTPMIEVAPKDYAYLNSHKAPYHGMMALGDEGQVYEYDGFSGFFKKLFKKAKKFVKKIGKGAKKLLKKIPGGKYLVKIGEKIHKIANKFVQPLVKFVGKYAAQLAPICAIIPGYGPALAAGLATAGKIAKLLTKHGVSLIGKKGAARNLKFKSADSAKKFAAELRAEAEATKKQAMMSRNLKKADRRSIVKARRAPFTPRGQRAIAALQTR